MQWSGGNESNDVEEGSSSRSGGRGMLFGGGALGLVGLVIYLFTGINPSLNFLVVVAAVRNRSIPYRAVEAKAKTKNLRG
jgi:predicted metalloprotease